MSVNVVWKDPNGPNGVITAEDYNRLPLPRPRRSGTRCNCGGPNPLLRAQSARISENREAPRVGACGCLAVYVLIDVSQLPQARGYTLPAPARYDAVRQREVPPPRVIKDWPLRCPKCGKAESAVMLFSSMDCRNGCFK